jgi:hypothetical protein
MEFRRHGEDEPIPVPGTCLKLRTFGGPSKGIGVEGVSVGSTRRRRQHAKRRSNFACQCPSCAPQRGPEIPWSWSGSRKPLQGPHRGLGPGGGSVGPGPTSSICSVINTRMELKGKRCQCGPCGQYFTTTSHFDKHRVGPYKERVGREGQCRRCLTYMKWSNTIFMPHVAR